MAPRTTTKYSNLSANSIEKILVDLGVDLTSLAFEDSSEQDYLSKLREGLATIEFKSKGNYQKNPKFNKQYRILQEEFLKVRKGKKKPQAKKTKISADSFKKKTSSVKALPGTSKGGALVAKKTKISAEDIKSSEDKNVLESILGSVTNIADMLREQYKLEEKSAEKDRKSTEKTKRKLQESGLEKAFKGLAKTTQKVIAPVKSLLDKIFGFITTVLLARFLNKFIDWFSDPDNRSKIQSIIRFLGDNWPKLLSAYIIFGTGLGKFSRFIVKLLARGAIRLAAATAGLLARLFGGKALGKFSRFLGKRGKIIAGGVEAVATIAAFKALEDSLTKGLGPEESASIDNDIPTKGYQGGGLVQPILLLNGGGGVNLNLLAPTNNILGYEGGSYVENPGEVDGPGGIDKVPAMLTDGEFVMSRGAVQKYGVAELEAMNASGGGTNKPKMMNNMVYASVGGYVGKANLGKRGTPEPDDSLGGFVKGLSGLSNGNNKNTQQNPILKAVQKISQVVLALKNGIQGKLDKATGKFTAGAFSDQEKARYTTAGGKIPEAKSKPKESPKRSDFPMGRSGAKKYSEALKKHRSESTSTTQPATPKTLTAKQLMGRSNVTPTTDQLNVTATKRHAELMKSTDPKRIADYDAKNGAGAYSKKLQEKLNKTYTPEKAKQLTQSKAKPMSTGKVVGRENLSPKAQKALARLDAQKAGTLPPDVKTSGPLLGRMAMGMMGGLNNMAGGVKNMMGGAKNMLSGGFDLKSFVESQGGTVKDGNIGTPTAQEQKDIDNLAAKKEKLRKTILRNSKPKPKEDDSALRAEFEAIKNDPNHPMHKKVVGFEATGNLDDFGMRLSDYKDYKKSKSAKVASTPPKVSIPAPPPKPEPKVVVADSGSGGGGSSSKGSGKGGSSDVNAANPGSGSKSKWNILGIPMPF